MIEGWMREDEGEVMIGNKRFFKTVKPRTMLLLYKWELLGQINTHRTKGGG